jgi:hypothetical protein
MKPLTSKSAYLVTPARLPDVIAAIQAMATYKFYKLSFEDWADRISGDKAQAQYWRQVFEQHPEFFRLDAKRQKASLVWRRQYPKRFHVDREVPLSYDEFYRLTDSEKERVSRTQLKAADIHMLITTAVDLHARQLESQRERRWWIPAATALAGLLGGLLGAAVG